jgi:transcriptional regulator with XRE-family HTH domain
MATLPEMLRAARTAAGVSREELAQRAGYSLKTAERMEAAAAKPPSRKHLLGAAHALGLDVVSVNALLTAAGQPPLTEFPSLRQRPLSALRQMIMDWEYPALAQNERVEIVAWNDAANRVAELDFARDRPELAQRSLFRIAVDPHFLPRVLNWEMIIGTMVQMYVTLQYDLFDPSKDPLYFQSLIADLMKSPRFPALMRLWQEAKPVADERRGFFPAQWLVEGSRILNFHCTVTGIDLFNGTGMISWYPADGQTWEWLRAGARLRAAPPLDDGAAEDDRPGRLLRWARDSTGFTQKQLAAKANISFAQLVSLEGDRRRFTEPIVNALAAALQMDAVMANELRLRAGLDAVPSEWAPAVLANRGAGIYYRYDPRQLADAVRGGRERLPFRVAELPYPCLAIDGNATILCANDLLNAALPASLRARAGQGGDLLNLLLGQEFRAAVADWQETARVLLHNLLHRAPGYIRPRCDSVSIVRRLDTLAANDAALTPLLAALTASLSRGSELEWRPVPLRFRQDDGTALRFIAVLATWNDYDTLWALDLHPADGVTWDWLNARSGRPS